MTVGDLEAIRQPLRGIMHYRQKQSGGGSARIIDILEDESGIVSQRRATNLRAVDMRAYRQLVEAELKKHFDTDPVLKKIRAGEPVSPQEVGSVVSLVLTQNPHVSRDDLNEFFYATAPALDLAIRSIVGLEPEAVKARFAEFVLKHPSMTAKQTRFLALLQNHIARHGFITIDKLYELPFTTVDADGPEGIFERAEELDELIEIVNVFAPPRDSGGAGSDEGTMH